MAWDPLPGMDGWRVWCRGRATRGSGHCRGIVEAELWDLGGEIDVHDGVALGGAVVEVGEVALAGGVGEDQIRRAEVAEHGRLVGHGRFAGGESQRYLLEERPAKPVGGFDVLVRRQHALEGLCADGGLFARDPGLEPMMVGEDRQTQEQNARENDDPVTHGEANCTLD
jgi:hypothetical protein